MADQLCGICGDVGYAELIATCSKCKVVHEHLYCMRVRTHVPEFWRCGNCALDEVKSPDDSGLQFQPRMIRHAKTSKVKFIPTEEVIKLSSGGVKGSSKLDPDFAPQRTSISRKVIPSSLPRPLFQASKESQERISTVMPPKVCSVKKKALAACLPPMLVGPVRTSKKVKVTDILARTSVPRHGLPTTNTGKGVPSASPKLEDTQKQMKDALMTKEIHTHRDYLPSLHASWEGGFQFVGTLMDGEFYDGFLAKPPCVVHGKAYELSRKIPPILQVKLLSRSDIWDDLFHDECPDLADIALYFFPSDNIERSRKNNSCLFELMGREDLLIRSLIDGAELVVFTSRQLDANSQYVVNRLNAECLLFGVFRAIEDNQSPSHYLGECPAVVPMLQYGPVVPSVECASSIPLLECAPSGHGKHDGSNPVNKEICTTDENTTGKSPTAPNDIDSTIQRLLLEFGSQPPRESDVNGLTQKVLVQHQEPTPISAIGSFSLSLSEVKTEPLRAIKVEGSDDKKCLETEKCPIMAPTFSFDGSQNRNGLLDQDVPTRVADKYLRIFNPGIKKERH